ncbi:MAG: lysophospholipid acyltransferase family protein [Ancalomicrobiaceae bacterium]|nr:lysophospholipid acyltransferase family protein [Ancalomicrobiaceae bacterium]
MIWLRSLAFNVFFYVNIVLWLILLIPFGLLPSATLWRLIGVWSWLNAFMLKHLAGIEVEFRGFENLPKGAVIIASKHQSAWETVSLLHVFDRPIFIMKRELTWIPLFGWYLTRLGMIPVDRGKGHSALRDMVKRAEVVAATGRQILIYPEGTRRAPGAEPAYKFGVAQLYRQLGLPCVPVALNSGLFWPRRGFLRRPGRIVVECLAPIPPGLERDAFLKTLQDRVETASDRLRQETLALRS